MLANFGTVSFKVFTKQYKEEKKVYSRSKVNFGDTIE